MTPTVMPGERLLLSYRRPVRAGDLVVAEFPDGTVAIKRAVERRRTSAGGAGWWLLSDNPDEGVDSRHRGAVDASAIRAVVVARVVSCHGCPIPLRVLPPPSR